MMRWSGKKYRGWEADFVRDRKGDNYRLTLRGPDGSVYHPSGYDTRTDILFFAKGVAKRLIKQRIQWQKEDAGETVTKKTVRF